MTNIFVLLMSNVLQITNKVIQMYKKCILFNIIKTRGNILFYHQNSLISKNIVH